VRVLPGLVIAAMVSGVTVGAAAPVAAKENPPPCITPYSNSTVQSGDYDDNGVTDLAVGAPGAKGGGGVEIRWGYGRADTWLSPGHGGVPSAASIGSDFGRVLTTVQANSDLCADLAIGLPNLTVKGQPGAGGVLIMLGDSSRKFHRDIIITQATHGVPGGPKANYHFGAAIAGRGSELAIGVPNASITPIVDGPTYTGAGEVIDVSFDTNGDGRIPNSQGRVIGLSDPVTGAAPQTNAHLGSSISFDGPVLAAGAPAAADAATAGAGCTAAFFLGFNYGQTFCGQQAGDELGASSTLDPVPRNGGITIGAPGRTVNGLAGAGAIEVYSGSFSDGQLSLSSTIDQTTPGIPGKPQADAHFGATLASGSTHDFRGHIIAIGAPGATVGKASRAGEVVVQRLVDGPHGLHSTWRLLDQAVKGVPGTVGAADHFGAQLTVAVRRHGNRTLTTSLVVGVPGDKVGKHAHAGSVEVFTDTDHGITTSGATELTNAHRVATNARFGASVA
jgi:hypothetical protein